MDALSIADEMRKKLKTTIQRQPTGRLRLSPSKIKTDQRQKRSISRLKLEIKQ